MVERFMTRQDGNGKLPNTLPKASECAWNRPEKDESNSMGNSKGRDNAKKRAVRRKKTERLALAKKADTAQAKK